MSSPSFRKCRPASAASCASATGSSASSASSVTTSAPSLRHTLPSSRPITPAPITHSRRGTDSSSSAPQESTMCVPSKGRPLSSVGTEPLASTTWRAASCEVVPSAPVTSTTRLASSRALPKIALTPAALKSEATPPVMLRTIAARRFCIAARSSARLPALIPCALNSCCARCQSSEDSSRALEGMQPAFRQVPPKALLPSRLRQASTQATLRPFCAARIAAGYPAGPPPITTTSYSTRAAAISDSKQDAARILQAVLDRHQELHGFLAVDDAMIVAEREVHHRPCDDLAVHHHRPLLR